jgi:hypothetical protein
LRAVLLAFAIALDALLILLRTLHVLTARFVAARLGLTRFAFLIGLLGVVGHG